MTVRTDVFHVDYGLTSTLSAMRGGGDRLFDIEPDLFEHMLWFLEGGERDVEDDALLQRIKRQLRLLNIQPAAAEPEQPIRVGPNYMKGGLGGGGTGVFATAAIVSGARVGTINTRPCVAGEKESHYDCTKGGRKVRVCSTSTLYALSHYKGPCSHTHPEGYVGAP
jgi:hypothetical protein